MTEPGQMGRLYREFQRGLEHTPRPTDHTFHQLWLLHTDTTREASLRLLEEPFGSCYSAAVEVRLHLERFGRVAAIAHDMPLAVPQLAVDAYRGMAWLIEHPESVEDLRAYFEQAGPIVLDLAGYAQLRLGRTAAPVTLALQAVAASARLMTDQLTRLLPAFTV